MVPSDEMPAERANRIADAVEHIEANVSRLREIQTHSRTAYKADENQDLRDAVERKFEKVTEATLDITEEILKQERENVPRKRKEKVSELERIDVIDADLSRKLRDSVEFRDVLSHTYGPIVNDDIVYDALQNSTERYVDFVAAVDSYLSNRRK